MWGFLAFGGLLLMLLRRTIIFRPYYISGPNDWRAEQ